MCENDIKELKKKLFKEIIEYFVETRVIYAHRPRTESKNMALWFFAKQGKNIIKQKYLCNYLLYKYNRKILVNNIEKLGIFYELDELD
jgi:hypothetical protein